MPSHYLGIDIAGASNTWMAVLVRTGGRPLLIHPPHRASLAGIVDYTQAHHVVAAAIDAQLTWAASEEEDTGFRPCDRELRQLLPREVRNWVASQNSLMAPETRYARFRLPFADESMLEEIKQYKSPQGGEQAQKLWAAWIALFGISVPDEPLDVTDGTLDALVCATVAYLYHDAPQLLLRLPYPAANKRGRGPFYVVRPAGPIEPEAE